MTDLRILHRKPRGDTPITPMRIEPMRIGRTPVEHGPAGGRTLLVAIVLLFAVLLSGWYLFMRAQDHALKTMAQAGPAIVDNG